MSRDRKREPRDREKDARRTEARRTAPDEPVSPGGGGDTLDEERRKEKRFSNQRMERGDHS